MTRKPKIQLLSSKLSWTEALGLLDNSKKTTMKETVLLGMFCSEPVM